MSPTRHTCPVHGLTNVMATGGAFLCTTEDPQRPGGSCGLPCGFPVEDGDTGEVYTEPLGVLVGSDDGADHYRSWNAPTKPSRQRPAKAPSPRPGVPPTRTTDHETPRQPATTGTATAKEEKTMVYMPRKPGTLTCATCGKDMEGEHNRAKFCAECREERRKPKSSAPASQQNGSTEPGDPDGPLPRVTPQKKRELRVRAELLREKGATTGGYDPQVERGEGPIPMSDPRHPLHGSVVPALESIATARAFIERVTKKDAKAAESKSLMDRIDDLEAAMALRDEQLAELRRVVLGEAG